MRLSIIITVLAVVVLNEATTKTKKDVDDSSDLETSPFSYATGYSYGGYPPQPAYPHNTYGGWHQPIVGATSYSNRYQEHIPIYKPAYYKHKSPYYGHYVSQHYGNHVPHYGQYSYYG